MRVAPKVDHVMSRVLQSELILLAYDGAASDGDHAILDGIFRDHCHFDFAEFFFAAGEENFPDGACCLFYDQGVAIDERFSQSVGQ